MSDRCFAPRRRFVVLLPSFFRAESTVQYLRRKYPKTARWARTRRSPGEVYWKGQMELEKASEIFQYCFRRTPQTRVSRASPPKFIGTRRRDFRFAGGYLDGFGLRIMNPPL